MSGRNLRVLVVDDEPEIRCLLTDILEGAGHEVASAPDGRSAERMLADGSGPFDLAFLDYHMPEGDGLAVMGRLREIQPDLRVVLVTGRTGPLPPASSSPSPDPDRSFTLLTKPFSLALVEALLAKAAWGEDL